MVTTRRQYKDREYVTHLLRRSYRKDGKIMKEALANLTALGTDLVNVDELPCVPLSHGPCRD